jgi:hypothetical protein
MVCGCEYKLQDRYIELPYGIRTCITNPDAVHPWFTSFGKLVDLGPGCKVMRVFVTEDPNRVLYRISVWGTLCFHVRIDLEDELRKADPTFSRPQGITLPDDPDNQLFLQGLKSRHTS